MERPWHCQVGLLKRRELDLEDGDENPALDLEDDDENPALMQVIKGEISSTKPTVTPT